MRGLVFVCSKPQPDAEANLAKRIGTIALAKSDGVTAIFDGLVQNLLGETARRDRPELVSEVRERMTLSTEALVAVQAGLATRPDSVPTVATIRAPILAIAGAEDSTVASAEMEAFRLAPGGYEFHLLPAAGHFAAYEQPREVAAFMAPWLRQFES
jgi:pimeloyl-ACP methyl ester carboxylesterase